MRKTRLPARELQICNRLREIREWLGFTQTDCARRVGIERGALVNYEIGRTPLRCDIGLRFCRQLILSEEWLATGRFEACHNVANLQKGAQPDADWAPLDRHVFIRQCVDLLSEPASLHIAPGTLFSEAYDAKLAPKYQELVGSFYHYPRIVFTDSDSPELAITLLSVMNERYIILLKHEAARHGLIPAETWRRFTRYVLEANDLIFKKFMGAKLDQGYMDNVSWLRTAVMEPDSPLGPMQQAIGQRSAAENIKQRIDGLGATLRPLVATARKKVADHKLSLSKK